MEQVIPDATVIVVSQDNTTNMRVVSDQAGHYRFEHLSPGSYLLSATAKELESSVVQTIDVTGDTQPEVELQLRLAAVRTSVTVTASGTAQTTDETAKSISIIDPQDDSGSGHEHHIRCAELCSRPARRAAGRSRRSGIDQDPADCAIRILRFLSTDSASAMSPAPRATPLDCCRICSSPTLTTLRSCAAPVRPSTALMPPEASSISSPRAGGGKTRGSVLLEGGSLGTFRGKAAASGSTLHNRLGYSLGAAHLNVDAWSRWLSA